MTIVGMGLWLLFCVLMLISIRKLKRLALSVSLYKTYYFQYVASSLDRIQLDIQDLRNSWVLRPPYPSRTNKKVEFDTPNRTYCSNPLCSAFKRPESIINEQATCLDYSTITCTLCKATAHGGDCPADTAL